MKRMIVAAFLFCFIQAYAKTPIPEALFNAKTAYIVNGGAEAKDIDKLRKSLTEWGRFEIVQDQKAADIAITLSTQIENQTVQMPSVYSSVSSQQVPVNHLSIMDAHDGTQLWTDKTTGTSKDPNQLVIKLKNKLKKK